jgi:hypothetical protein
MNKLPPNQGKNSLLYSNADITTLVDSNGNSLFGVTVTKSDLYLTGNKLVSLKGCPTRVIGDFSVARNPLISLEHGPEEVIKDYVVSETKITTFSGAPKFVGGDVYARDLDNLKSLKNIHRYFKFIGKGLILENTKLESHILGIFKIQGLTWVRLRNTELEKICNEALKDLNKTDPDRKSTDKLLAIQDSLIDAGFEDFALL